MSTIARLRADTDIRLNGEKKAQVIDRFPTNCLVEILEDLGDWVKIKPVRLKRTTSGYAPRQALLLPQEAMQPVFPSINRGNKTVPSVSASVKLSDFRQWMTAGGKPTWFTDSDWISMTITDQQALRNAMLLSTQAESARWEIWLTQVDADSRQDDAVMDEWVATLQGGREIYTIRDHYVYKQPAQNAAYWGCALKGQVMRWSGEVKTKLEGTTRRQFYRVTFYRMSQEMNGWFRGDLTQEYFFPADANDPEVAMNNQNVFDLTKPILRSPQDPEFTAAKAAKLTGAQYLDIRKVIGKALRHYCLCGEICVAAMGGVDVIPLLTNWNTAVPKYSRGKAILTNAHEGTHIGDLQSLLPLANLPKGQTYSSNPGTPWQIKERLNKGQVALAICSINRAGIIKADGTIRHWVVLEDVLPVGNNGWVRVYNPFQNREEVYDYNTFMASAGTGTGLWLDVPTA
jgi:hypothetical protein